jgi:autotransporter-associated beta strand protein
VLTGSNVYTGGTTVSAGDLLLAASYALPGGIATTGGTSNLVLAGTGSDTPVIVLAAGDFTRGLGTSTAEVQFTGNGGFAAAGANRIVNLGGASAQVTWGASNFVPSGSVLVLGSPNADSMLDFRNPINLGAAPRTVQVNVGYAGASVDATLSGALTGAGGLIVAGDGTLALTSTNNAYTGGTTLAGASTLDFASGALPPTAAAIAFAGGILQWASGNTQDVSGRFAPIDAGQTANIDTNGNGVTFFNALSGPGGLTKIGGGTLTLAMSNTFTGTTTISGGTLALGNSQALAYSTLYYNNSGGTLSFGSLAAATLGGLAGSQNLPALPAGFVLTVGPNNQSTLYSGVLSGSGSLVKAGSGTLTLTAGNRYTGGTSVTGGTLVAQDAAAIPSGSLLEIGEGGSLVLGQTGSQYVEGFAQIAGSPLGSQATGTSGGALAPAAGDPQAGAPVKPAPEPGTLALLAAAAACGLAAAGRRRLQG